MQYKALVSPAVGLQLWDTAQVLQAEAQVKLLAPWASVRTSSKWLAAWHAKAGRQPRPGHMRRGKWPSVGGPRAPLLLLTLCCAMLNVEREWEHRNSQYKVGGKDRGYATCAYRMTQSCFESQPASVVCMIMMWWQFCILMHLLFPFKPFPHLL